MWRERTASPPKELPIVFFLEPVKEVLKSFFQIFFFLARIAAVPRAVSVNKAVLYLLLSAWRAIFLDPLRKSLEERTCDEEVCVCAPVSFFETLCLVARVFGEWDELQREGGSSHRPD